MTIEYRVGDLFEFEGQAIAHGCNTKGLMGAGIARIIADKYPDVFLEYAAACSNYNLTNNRFVPGDAQLCYNANGTVVFNLATQNHPGPSAQYHWVERSFARMFELMHVMGVKQVAIPRIGCGIGGLKWHGVEESIKRAQATAPGEPTVVVYTHTSEEHKEW